MAALKVSSRNVTPTPSVPPTAFERGRRPRLAFHHLGKQGQPHGNDFAFLGKPGHGLFEELFLFLALFRWLPGKSPKARPKAANTFLA